MSKSLGNYVGVTDPPDEMYGKTLSIPDESLSEWYSLLLGRELPGDTGPRDAKRALARALVERFHDADTALAAEQAFDRVHVEHKPPEDMPEVEFSVPDGVVHLPALLAHAFGVSTSEARRTIAAGGVRIDGEPVDAADLDLPADAVDGHVVQLGKRRFARVRIG
jgi:tyrosyl-tRNA synthetase